MATTQTKKKEPKVKSLKVMTKKTKYAVSRESEYSVMLEGSRAITIKRDESNIETRLQVGETAIHSSGHVNHFGVIEKITDKSVRIQTGTTTSKRLDMHEFCRNNFNLERE